MAKGRGARKGSRSAKTSTPKKVGGRSRAASASAQTSKPTSAPLARRSRRKPVKRGRPAPKQQLKVQRRATTSSTRAIPPPEDTLPQGTLPPSALAASADEPTPETVARMTQLDWNDGPREPLLDGLVQRWTRRGEELLQRLTDHAVAHHEYRADLREGRFVWLDQNGRVSAEAATQVVCSWSRSTSVVAMAWSDPLVRGSSIARVDGMASERDDVDEEQAWRIAMEAAEACGAEYIYRVPSPHAWYFLALRALTFVPTRDSFHPSAPVGMVLRSLAETRQAIESRAEPAEVVRDRIAGTGGSFLHQADYAYRGSDWVARLQRSGRRLMHLAGLIPRASYGSVAAGRPANEWLERDLAGDLIRAIGLLEDEWNAFA
jgi:hypothetical protein